MSDLVLLIILLGVVVGIALGAVLPLMDADLMGYNEKLDDKSVTVSFEDAGSAQYNGEMNIMEALLMLQVQDEKMPEPRIVTVEGGSVTPEGKIEIDGTFKNTLLADTNNLWQDTLKRYGNIDNVGKGHTFRYEYFFLDTKDSGGNPVLEERMELTRVK